MKKIILLFLLFNSSYLNAQNTFEKVIDTLGNQAAYCIKETFDGGYVFCGSSSYNGNDATVVKLDSAGTIEWANVYTGSGIEGGMYIEQLPDSGYMLNAAYNNGTNAKLWLLRLDANGDTLWTQLCTAGPGSTEVNLPNSMASINNTIYGLTGSYSALPNTKISPVFIAVQSNGFQLASKVYDYSPEGVNGNAIAKTFDDGFIISSAYAYSLFLVDFYLIRITAFGDTLWTRKINYSVEDAGMDIKQTADSGFIVAGYTQNSSTLKYNVCLFKTNAFGDTLWAKRYGGNYNSSATSVSQTTDGGYILTGTLQIPTLNATILLMKTDSNGDTLWTKHFGNPQISNHGYFVRQTKDGGYIICGDGYIGNNYGSYIIKTDSMGNVASSTGLAELNNPFVFSVYPNPSSGVFTLQVKGFPKTTAAIEVYNLTNECVYACNINNNETEQINLSHLPNGIYAVRLRTQNKIASQKIIIQK